ncbi:MAG: 4-alpha-glucanotransferase, partial [Chitinophagaceae bacterium]
MKIHFYLRFHTNPGQQLFISGNTATLGDSDESSAAPMQYLNSEYWQIAVAVDPAENPKIQYNYLLKNADGSEVIEWGDDKIIDTGKSGIQEMEIHDTWNHAGEFDNVFYTDPFRKVLLNNADVKSKPKAVKNFTHIFRVKAPLLEKNEVVCILGSDGSMADWNTSSPVLLFPEGNWWSVKLNLPREPFNVTYKYGIYNT